jgi:uncharacterized Rmd1/YagE family protein
VVWGAAPAARPPPPADEDSIASSTHHSSIPSSTIHLITRYSLDEYSSYSSDEQANNINHPQILFVVNPYQDAMTEQTPLMNNRAADAAERGLGDTLFTTSPVTTPTATFNKGHLRTFSSNKNNNNILITSTTKATALPKINDIEPRRRSRSVESGHLLTVTSKQTKTRQRKNVGAFRRTRQDYATWKGRVGVHVEYDEFDLKKLLNDIYQTLPSKWELVDCYDVIRMWLPIDTAIHSFSEEDVPSGEGAYADGDGQIHASMPEVFVFGFGAVVFWNFKDKDAEKQWIEQYLFPHKEVLGLKHNVESIESACDEMGFCYGEKFGWHRDVVQLRTRDAGEKLAVSFAFAKSANLSIYEWRLEQAIQRNAHIPEDLAEHGQLHLNRKEINVEIGRLYLLNNAINLETNMLDTPEVTMIAAMHPL